MTTAQDTLTILHLGLGSFHRAHQALYLHQLHQLGDTRWVLAGGNLRPDMQDTIAALQAQGGAYTLETVTAQGERSYTWVESIRTVVPYTPDLAGLIADVTAYDFETRVAIIRSKLDERKSHVGDDVEITVVEVKGDMVRLGIAMYGLHPSGVTRPMIDLHPAMSVHARITDVLVAGARQSLAGNGIGEDAIDVVRVPGAWEIPLVATRLAAAGRHAAIITLGCVIRGDTRHYEHVADLCAQGLMRVALDTGVPVLNGVLAVERVEDAEARAGGSHGNKGEEAALAALEMVNLLEQLP